MAGARVPTGLLVTPLKISIFRDTFRDYTDASIEYVGGVETSRIEELEPFVRGINKDPIAFENAVQDWLSQLRNRYVAGHMRSVDPRFLDNVIQRSCSARSALQAHDR